MGHFWWIVFIIASAVAVGAFVHPFAAAGPMFLWLIVEFCRTEYIRRHRHE
jgi:hypothetical protein